MNDRPPDIAVYALTSKGAEVARAAASALPAARLFLPGRLAEINAGEVGFDRLSTVLTENWSKFEGHVCGGCHRNCSPPRGRAA